MRWRRKRCCVRCACQPATARQGYKLGNQFGLVGLELPIGEANPVARVFEVRRRMSGLKNGYQAAVSMALLGVVGYLPKGGAAAGTGLFSTRNRSNDQRTWSGQTRFIWQVARSYKTCSGCRRQECRRWRLNPFLRRRRAVWPDNRPQAVPRSRGHHPSLRAGVRQAGYLADVVRERLRRRRCACIRRHVVGWRRRPESTRSACQGPGGEIADTVEESWRSRLRRIGFLLEVPFDMGLRVSAEVDIPQNRRQSPVQMGF